MRKTWPEISAPYYGQKLFVNPSSKHKFNVEEIKQSLTIRNRKLVIVMLRETIVANFVKC